MKRALPEHAVVEGERAILVPQSPEHAEAAYTALRGNDRILRWLVWDGPRDLAEMRDIHAVASIPGANGTDWFFTILDARTRGFAGGLTARFSGHPEMGDVGYWIAEPSAGRGIASEALHLFAWLAFEHLGARMLSAYVFDGNHASERVLAKSGFRYVRTVPGRAIKAGVRVSERYFVVLREEWLARDPLWRPRRVRLSGEEGRGRSLPTGAEPIG
jgi:ribosomal-protein-alanine N-acetyltransferase